MGHAYGCHAFEIGEAEGLYSSSCFFISYFALSKLIKEVKKGFFKWIKTNGQLHLMKTCLVLDDSLVVLQTT